MKAAVPMNKQPYDTYFPNDHGHIRPRFNVGLPQDRCVYSIPNPGREAKLLIDEE